MAKVKIDVEDLVEWALAKEHVDVGRSEGIERELRLLSGGTMSATGAVEAFMQLGTRVDGGGRSKHTVPPDAVRVGQAIDRLEIEAAALVVNAGLSGRPLDWAEEGVGSFVPVLDRRGNHKKRWQDTHHCRGLMGWDYEFVGHMPSDLDFIRLQYWTWWQALLALRVALEGTLTRWEVTGPRRSVEPWNDAPIVVHHVDFESLDVG